MNETSPAREGNPGQALRVTLRTKIAATVAVAVLGSTIAVTYAAYELERDGTETRFVAAARTGMVADLQQAASAIKRQPTADPAKTVGQFVGQRGGIQWAVGEGGAPEDFINGGIENLSAIPPEVLAADGRLVTAWTTNYGSRMLALGATVAGGPLLVEFYDFGPVDRQLQRLRSDLIRLDVIGLLVALVLGVAVATGISRPVRLAAAAARRFGRGELDTRMPVHGNDELGELARAFNEMAQRLSDAMRALHAAQAQQRRFVADVSHELRTPLSAMLAGSEGLASDQPDLRRRSAELVRAQTRRMNRLVEDLLEISRFDAGQVVLDVEPIDLGALAFDVVSTVAPDADVRVQVLGDPNVEGDARRLHAVLRNLIGNAVQHGAPPVHVHVDGRAVQVTVTVLDAGPGVDPVIAPTIFDRFVRADSSRSTRAGGGSTASTGLGLAIARENATLHGATLILVPGPVSAFALTLPRRPPLPRPEAKR